TGTNVSQQVSNKIIALVSVVAECSRTLDNRSTPFLRKFQSYFPKLASIVCKSEIKIQSLAEEYSPTGEERLLLGPILDGEIFQTLQRVNCKGQVVCTQEYNRIYAPSTINHCIRTEQKACFYIVNKIIHSVKSDRISLICHKLQ